MPKGIPRLNHVFAIMLENHDYSQIVNNPNAPFINRYAQVANSATNYFAIAHPSLTNYLEVVSGSNLLVVDTNYGPHGLLSSRFYSHFSLLKSLESGLNLPCLNHACDANVNVMSDLFRGRGAE